MYLTGINLTGINLTGVCLLPGVYFFPGVYRVDVYLVTVMHLVGVCISYRPRSRTPRGRGFAFVLKAPYAMPYLSQSSQPQLSMLLGQIAPAA
jgi:hypothetical protein